MITGTTQLLGVIGYPIAHSLSPVMHNAAIAELGVDFVYLPFAIVPEHLKQAIQGFEAIGLRGFSVTIPHKQAIMPLLSEVSPVAQAIGAVNTVWRTEQGWFGTNTDVEGFLAPLRRMQRDWSQSTAVILGNGGAARAVVAGCADLGCRQIQVVGRNSEKLQGFLQSWQTSPIADLLSVHAWEGLPKLLPEASLLVNTTPIGMHPQDQATPLTASEIQALAAGTIAYDLIYTPRPTLFLQQAQQQGAVALDGLEMLVQQGAAALQLWLQQPAPVDVMRQSLWNYLDRKF
ncbi:shikimate dehydrogenase [Leptolyngbya sp. NK1-12]|uniref:Shikimate dehydrogenase (NADP(+)) n=1 Tax=Leptolyngbya sp. NK1-12 TaxID=2547451 RepID=A0AA96WFQ7_9CYAN|nr:shikimate dehydrogenase [Leptolyngbya sp. NK1-12]WNZ24219.1 shikimate dehydrogenase [Leptolyngbya sp. NK1-12]